MLIADEVAEIAQRLPAVEKIRTVQTVLKPWVKTAKPMPELKSAPERAGETVVRNEKKPSNTKAELPETSVIAAKSLDIRITSPKTEAKPQQIEQQDEADHAPVAVENEIPEEGGFIHNKPDPALAMLDTPDMFKNNLGVEVAVSMPDGYTEEPLEDALSDSLYATVQGNEVVNLEAVELSELVLTERGAELVAHEHAEDITTTYEVLMAVIKARGEYVHGASTEDGDELAQTTVLEAERVTFEAYLNAHHSLEGVPDLEAINALTGAEQPLEETLRQLAEYLSEAPADEAPIVRQLLTEIQKYLPVSLTEEQSVETVLTKEITQKLLSLLLKLGYQNPERTLYQYFVNHNLEFLLQAIKYLYQLTCDDNQHEARHFGIAALMWGSSRQSLFAGTIFGLIAVKLGIKFGLSEGAAP